MARKYPADLWELESLLDSTRYTSIASCVDLVEDQVGQFDDRNDTSMSKDFGDLIQAAFLMATVAQMESHLKKICDVVGQLRNVIVRTTDLKGGSGFDSCVNYLQKILQIPLPEMELKAVRRVVDVRNRWVHDGGYVQKMTKHGGQAQKHLRLDEDGQIYFAGPFVQETNILCKSFVEKVELGIREQHALWANRKKTAKRPRN